MKSTRSWVLLIGVEILAACVCLGILGLGSGIISEINLQSAQLPPTSTLPAASATTVASRTPVATETPAPTYTRVIPPLPPDYTPPPLVFVPRTPTREPIPYNVKIPTPTLPAMLHPIKLDSSLRIVTYPVTGKTENDLSQSLRASAFPDSNEPDGRFNARTDWSLSAQWFVEPTARGCEVVSGTVTLAMTMTLPVLTSNIDASPDTLNRWTTFISNTITHESGHVTRAFQDVGNFQHDLGNALPAADCATLKPRLNDLFDRATSTLRQTNVDYDAETQHGVKQGAVFP